MPPTLMLEVAGRHAAQFGSNSRKSFEGKGGSIGRADECDWVLASTAVSRVHAVVRHLNGMYFIEDRSTNGMLLNGKPLVKGEPATVSDGDRLTIDNFEVEIKVCDAAQVPPPSAPAPAIRPAPSAAAAPAADDPFDFGFGTTVAAPAAPPPLSQPGSLIGADLDAGWINNAPAADLDPLSFLGPADGPTPSASANTTDRPGGWNHSAGSADHFRPPMTADQRQAGTLPENWDLATGMFMATPAASPAPPVAAPPSVQAVEPPARPAPARPAPPPPAPVVVPVSAAPPAEGLSPEVEAVFRIVVDGVMDVLHARAEIKNSFRLPVTMIQRTENNPLKFAATPEEAMQKIMAPPGTAFLSGAAAFQDAFDDIRAHQMAMLAGVRAAFESLLAHFAPERTEREVDGGGKRSGFMDFAGKGKYWEKYRENFEALKANPDERFRRLFGDEFARAYEEQLSRLKSARRMQQGGGR